MTDPVTRAAKRQNLRDRIAEQLTEWGCPPDAVATRAAGLIHLAEEHGWQLPTVAVPPTSGRGSTREGIDRARRIYEWTRAGCRCPQSTIALDLNLHLTDCPVRDAHTGGPESAQNDPRQDQETSGVSQ